MIMSLILFENEFLNIVSISFTALVLNELIMVALEITTWCETFSTFDLDRFTEMATLFLGTFIWLSRRLPRCCYTPSASCSYQNTLVRGLISP